MLVVCQNIELLTFQKLPIVSYVACNSLPKGLYRVSASVNFLEKKEIGFHSDSYFYGRYNSRLVWMLDNLVVSDSISFTFLSAVIACSDNVTLLFFTLVNMLVNGKSICTQLGRSPR